MELRHLRTFVEVARLGGFSRAARTLFSTQSTVSKAIGQLEAELGEALFERLATGVRLTGAGELVYARAVAMLAEGEHMVAELADLRGMVSGRLRLGLPIFGSARLFAPLFAQYRQRYPGVDIELLEQGSARLEEAVLAGEVELAVSLLPVPDAFAWQPVCDDPMMAVLWADHPLGGRAALKLTELAQMPLMLFEQGFVLYGYELLGILVLLGLDDLHDVEVHRLFFTLVVFVTGVLARAAVAAAVVLRLGIAQHNVFLTVVKEVADNL